MKILSIAIFLFLPLYIFSQKTEIVTDPEVQPVVPMEQDTTLEVIAMKGVGVLKDTFSDIPFIAFERNIMDFGRITYGDKVTCIYRFTNRSFENIKIDYIQSVSSMTAFYHKNVIEMGNMGFICMTFYSGLTANKDEIEQPIIVGFKTSDNKKSYIESLSLKAHIEKPERIITQSDSFTTTTSY
jgi:Protein of unknown function (DUF1573)